MVDASLGVEIVPVTMPSRLSCKQYSVISQVPKFPDFGTSPIRSGIIARGQDRCEPESGSRGVAFLGMVAGPSAVTQRVAMAVFEDHDIRHGGA